MTQAAGQATYSEGRFAFDSSGSLAIDELHRHRDRSLRLI
jgi:hypothetical protein